MTRIRATAVVAIAAITAITATACTRTNPAADVRLFPAGPAAATTPIEDLEEARELDGTPGYLHDPGDVRFAWGIAAAAWDRVVIRAALSRRLLRDAAAHALYAIRLARPPDEEPPPAPVPPPPARVARELAAVDRYVALLDPPDGPDALRTQFDAAQLAAKWGDRADAIARLERVLGARRDLDVTPIAAELLIVQLSAQHDVAGMRRWIDTLLGDAAFVAQFPDAALRLRMDGRQLDIVDATHAMDGGDWTACADGFARAAAAADRDADTLLWNAAICRERAGRARDAIALYRDLVRRFPSSPLAARATRRLAELHAP